ncbi:CvpA family protein [Ignatzschineria rhizosphaerae]|uniref:CvpA family protein n=1 Tax=Ignatzschineria rhizosphaerae TaxID=2923279 RepID=A0ABY3X0P7_9GAMM|nr:CvpA family protein [Ignatzschineria rhizosphaerae]UNM96462.1 CvpA family protein [Ignatzschineria rhizosphaerae]
MDISTIIDAVIIAIIAISVIVAFFRGFISEALSLVVWILAFMGAVMYYQDVGEMLPKIFGGSLGSLNSEDSIFSDLISFAITFIGLLILLGLANLLITFILRRLSISWPDRLLGAIFGLLRGMFIVAIISLFVIESPFKETEYWSNAKLSNMATSWAHTLSSFIPENFLESINTAVIEPAKESIQQGSTSLREQATDAVIERISQPNNEVILESTEAVTEPSEEATINE